MPKKIDIITEYRRKPTVRNPVNIIKLDILLAGGFPKGDYVELCSDSGLGKSSIALQIAKYYAVHYGVVIILDFEQAFTDEMIDTLGVRPFLEKGSIIILQPITYNDAHRCMDNLPVKETPALIIVDSITGIQLDPLKSGADNHAVGAKAREEASFLLKYKGWARKNDVTCLFVNQIRTKFRSNMQAYIDSAGGNALKFYCDVRLFMRRIRELARKEKTLEGVKEVPYGNEVEVMCRKNRGERSGIGVTVEVIFGRGISNIKSVADIMVNAGLIVQAGSYFKIDWAGEQKTVQGWSGLIDYVKGHLTEMKDYIQKAGLLQLTTGVEYKG